LINTAAKVLEKVLINRIMHHIYSNNIMSKSQYGFTPQANKHIRCRDGLKGFCAGKYK
jgi:hypothetical protein